MERLIREGYFVGVLGLTTTELADELVGGVLGVGPWDRPLRKPQKCFIKQDACPFSLSEGFRELVKTADRDVE
jgi:hypothetical protein